MSDKGFFSKLIYALGPDEEQDRAKGVPADTQRTLDKGEKENAALVKAVGEWQLGMQAGRRPHRAGVIRQPQTAKQPAEVGTNKRAGKPRKTIGHDSRE